jgi:aldehyde dehydrogenase (NAD+)
LPYALATAARAARVAKRSMSRSARVSIALVRFVQPKTVHVNFAQRVQAGMTHVNDSPVNDLPNCPFGGEKNSGLGRYNGRWSIEELTTVHWISVQHEPVPYPF